MKLMMEPGSALIVMAVVAFLARFVVGAIPLIGGILSFILAFAMVFGLIGGIYLIVTGRRRPA